MTTQNRKYRERSIRKRQILDAARAELLDKGMKHTRITDIARRAELGTASLYFYFKNKEEIFTTLQELGLALLNEQIKTATASGQTPAEKLHRAAEVYLAFSLQHRDFFDVISYFITSPDKIFGDDLLKRIHIKGSAILDQVTALIGEGIQTGIFNPTEPRRFALFFWSALHGMILLQKMGHHTVMSSESHADFYRFGVLQLIQGITSQSTGPVTHQRL